MKKPGKKSCNFGSSKEADTIANVFVHSRAAVWDEWKRQSLTFDRIPTEDEFITLNVAEEWYEVGIVLHTPLDPEVDAEIYIQKVDRNNVYKSMFKY